MLSLKSHQLLVAMERRRVSVRPRRAAIKSLYRLYEHHEDFVDQEEEAQVSGGATLNEARFRCGPYTSFRAAQSHEEAPRLANGESLPNVRNTYVRLSESTTSYSRSCSRPNQSQDCQSIWLHVGC